MSENRALSIAFGLEPVFISRALSARTALLVSLVWPHSLVGCRYAGRELGEESSPSSVTAASYAADPSAPPPPWATALRAAPPSKGMVWIEGGSLVAGTPVNVVPRKADREMSGEQVVLDGFYIDEYAYPNEQGAIPTTGVTQADAEQMCEERGKRLCTELEWERACKGPSNSMYEYGDRYQGAICGTGGPSRPLPSGYRFGCRSEFGVHDLHGSLWEWTKSEWGRGTDRGWVTQRGGNGDDGEVVGRCANGRARAPNTREPDVGFRCCSGPANAAEVTLEVGEGSVLRRALDPKSIQLMRSLDSKIPSEVAAEMKKRGLFHMVQLWEWKPVANEDLVVALGCAGVPDRRRCGALFVRRTLGRLDVLGWVPSGRLVPSLQVKYEPLRLWVFGGDLRSHYKIPVDFAWGKVAIGEPQRNIKDKGGAD